VAAAVLTLLLAAVFIVPVLLGVTQAAKQAPELAATSSPPIRMASRAGLHPAPAHGRRLDCDWWQATLSQPHGLAHLMSDREINGFHSASDMIKVAGVGFMHRLVNFGLAFLCLFFFYKDGEALNRQITAIGSHWFGEERWSHYAQKMPTAIRATVNGLVLVGWPKVC
jgi:predicted PurR-regulated permease PerM